MLFLFNNIRKIIEYFNFSLWIKVYTLKHIEYDLTMFGPMSVCLSEFCTKCPVTCSTKTNMHNYMKFHI